MAVFGLSRGVEIMNDTGLPPSLRALVRTPLQQVMLLLWGLGLYRLSERLLTGTAGESWPLVASLGALAGLLLAGHFGWFRAMALSVVLVLGAVLVFLQQRGISDPAVLMTVTGGGALVCWLATCRLLRQALIRRMARVLHFTGENASARVEQGVHICALGIALLVVILSVMLYLDALLLYGETRVRLLLSLLMAMVLFGLAGWYYQSRLHSYLLLGTLVCAVLMAFAWIWLPRHTDASGVLLGSPVLSLVLALLALIQATLASGLSRYSESWSLYIQPLYVVAMLVYSAALAVLVALVALAFLAWPAQLGDVLLSWTLAVLCLGLFPMLRPLEQASRWRGIGLVLLLSGFSASLVDVFDMAVWRWSLIIVWGYVLWVIGNAVWPRFNKRWPDWTVDDMIWPWLGLLFVLWGWSEDPLAIFGLAAVALYLFLLLRNCAWIGLSWLAVGMLLATGLAWGAWWPVLSIYLPAPPGSLWTLFGCFNVLFLLMPVWRRYGPSLADRWGWRRHDLGAPLALLPFALLLMGLTLLSWMMVYGLLFGAQGPSFLLLVLLLVSVAHGFVVWPGWVQAHALLFALYLTVLAGIMPTSNGAWLALVSTLWSIALLATRKLWPWAEHWHKLKHALHVWACVMPWIVALLLLLHGAQVCWVLAGGGGVLPDAMAVAAAVAAALFLLALSVRQARRDPQQEIWIYLCAVLLGGIGVYLRLLNLGLTPPGPVDTAVLIATAYVVFFVQRYSRSQPLYRIALILPLLALLTLPVQLASAHAGSALLAIAVLYLMMRRVTANPIPLYLGVLALNAGMYLWIPVWAQQFGLFQLYVMPAAVTVLVLLHLHRRELRPGVLNGARLAALSILYASAGLDVFLRPEFMLFALALGLSILGIILGIALRIRVFLYTGVAFLVLNVTGQLLQFYPEQRLGRALLLIGLGVVITLGMVGFSLKREAILKRVRVFRADLEAWE